MTDPRETPDPDLVTRNAPAQITTTVSDLCRAPQGPRDRQLIFGDAVTVLGDLQGWRLIRAQKDGYCGYVAASDLGAQTKASHRVTAPSTQIYARADIKSPDTQWLTFGSVLAAVAVTDDFVETAMGFVPKQHVDPIHVQSQNPTDIAGLFLGTPYLWGGNTRLGIDCSGLVQAACLACGVPCPGDSDQQQKHLGRMQPAGSKPRPGDLLFWKGHVALVKDADRLIHANGHHMAVVLEPIADAIARIAAQGGGPVTAHKRL
ncbi:MAG: C40 family peptidase [Sulfitobacter sp.]